MSIRYQLRPNGLCVITVSSKRIQTKLFSRMAMFQDDALYRGKAHAPRDSLHQVLGQNFSRESLQSFLDTVRDSEIPRLFRYLERMRRARFFVSHVRGDRVTRKHEMQHFQFFDSPRYKSKVTHAWRRLPTQTRQKISRWLRQNYRYHPAVHTDEWQAFLVSEPLTYWRRVSTDPEFLRLMRRLRAELRHQR
jgi:hypothetical protein